MNAPVGCSWIWIAASDQETEGTWKFYDNEQSTRLVGADARWENYEPNNAWVSKQIYIYINTILPRELRAVIPRLI